MCPQSPAPALHHRHPLLPLSLFTPFPLIILPLLDSILSSPNPALAVLGHLLRGSDGGSGAAEAVEIRDSSPEVT